LFFPSVLSKNFGNDFRVDIWRVVRVVEGAALEILRVEWNRRGWEALKTLGILELGGQRFGRVLIEILRIIK